VSPGGFFISILDIIKPFVRMGSGGFFHMADVEWRTIKVPDRD
jgi:hypothetical protein